MTEEKKSNGVAITALIFGILGIIIPIFIFAIVALILGIVGLTKSKKLGGAGKGLAIAGIIMGAVGLVFLPIIIGIGALAYFGALNVENFLPSSCEFGNQLECSNFGKTGEIIEFELTNQISQKITIKEVNYQDESGAFHSCTGNQLPTTLSIEETAQLSCNMNQFEISSVDIYPMQLIYSVGTSTLDMQTEGVIIINGE
jgi:hypothetical protein